MSHHDTSAARVSPTAAGRARLRDPLVRVVHWSLAASCATAFSVEDHRLDAHVWTSYLAWR